MSLYAFHLRQIISTVLGQVDYDGQHGNAARTPIRAKRPKLTTPKNDAFATVLSTKPYGCCEVLILFRESAFRGGHW